MSFFIKVMNKEEILVLPLEMSPGREAACRAVFGTWVFFFPNDARKNCPFVLTSFTGWSSERCPASGSYQEGTGKSGHFFLKFRLFVKHKGCGQGSNRWNTSSMEAGEQWLLQAKFQPICQPSKI